MPEAGPPAVRIPAGENPFGVEIWDCSAFTQNMLSTTGDPALAANFVKRRSSTGVECRDQPIDAVETIPCDLAYSYQGEVQDGVVFRAECMEDKWDIYLYSPYLYFVRSWSGQLIYRATLRSEPGLVRVTQIEVARGEEAHFNRQVVDFLIKSHLFRQDVPHPLPPTLPREARQIAIWSFSSFGRRCRYGTYADTSNHS